MAFSVCQKTCSGHGQCDQRTRSCQCDIFWMPNIIKLLYQHESNCGKTCFLCLYFVLARERKRRGERECVCLCLDVSMGVCLMQRGRGVVVICIGSLKSVPLLVMCFVEVKVYVLFSIVCFVVCAYVYVLWMSVCVCMCICAYTVCMLCLCEGVYAHVCV